ncbi:MAG: hypothetical protein PHS79_05285 [Patescibacteria group bacterium]|nr:hypothetical protein [Patescibacteria group bacterium]
MQFKGNKLVKKILVGLTFLSLIGLSLVPAGATFAQTVMIQDPGATPPFDANVQSCALILNQAAIVGTLVPNMPQKTYQEIYYEYEECMATKGQKQADWFYRRAQYLNNQWSMRIMTSLYGGLIDSMSMISQRIAYEAASDLLTGNPGNEPRFWNSDFGTWLDNAGNDASSKFIDRLDVVVGDWTESTTATVDPKTGQIIPGVRFSFCSPPDPYTLKMSLGIGEVARIGPGACNLKKVADNFKAIGELLSSGEALQVHRPSVTYGASDLSVGVETNSAYFNYMLNERAGLALNRQEDQGLRPVMDVVSGKIKIPTILAANSYQQLDPVRMGLASEQEQRSAILSAYWTAGLENIPILALTTFSNTLIVGLLHKWLDPNNSLSADGLATPDQINITFQALQNADATGDAQDLYERKSFAKALGDFLVPNFSTNEDQDIVLELTTCNTPRGRFSCAMDQALGVAISVGTNEGALTVGRAAGVGAEGATYSVASRALHSDWELIPESDIKNNTDPTCAQRAYCAGNLKKMRLARIIPIGWEMAANSPYNIKHGGKYITLGEVIRGFYDCNDQGQIDNDHPWCHLVDPDWILTAPSYQCRAKGYGDAVLPEVGTRLQECGDMVSCLKTDQNGQCTGGYGYCLAERPVWKFDAQECKEQFVSCRTYNYSGGQISLLRNTEDKGKCSEENIGCTWYSTLRYPFPATADKSLVDGLWVGTVTSGPRVYMDAGVQPCSSEGCTKMLKVEPGSSALNLIQNGSFENLLQRDDGSVYGVTGWTAGVLANPQGSDIDSQYISQEANSGSNAYSFDEQGDSASIGQRVKAESGRNYVLSYDFKQQGSGSDSYLQVGFYDSKNQKINDLVTSYGDCQYSNTNAGFSLMAGDHAESLSWVRRTCQFVTPLGTESISLIFKNYAAQLLLDAVQLEEGETVTPFIDGIASGLKESYLKIAPDEYKCTGDDSVDHPGCQRFARVCRQIDVGCQGYQDLQDFSAPEVPAILSSKDLCPAICAGYGEYRKLASAFDLVKDPAQPEFDDPQDETTAYFIPNLADKCSFENVGCDPFTSMESSTSTGESVSYYKDVRLCQKPNEKSATYYTWEGSEVSGYQLRTWSLVADTDDFTKVASSAPKLVLRGGTLGYIKDPATCSDVSWKFGNDPDCRQFFDVQGNVYYRFYSQTISSDAACTTYRKDEVTQDDCTKTGGDEFVAASNSCIYHALPSESLICSADASGCRAYMGPTGRNSVNMFRDNFATGTQVIFDTQQGGNVTLQYSNESVLVGDKSLKMQAPAGSQIKATLKLALPNTNSLMRVSFWAKANVPKSSSDSPSQILVDGVEVGTFYPDVNWGRFEVGPFNVKDNPTLIDIVVPSKVGNPSDNIVYLDTFSVDQLNDVQFVRKNRWSIPLACDSTPEGAPEPRYMVGCREYKDRNDNQVFASNFSRLCRDTAIGCSAFIDTNDKPTPYSETKTIKGTSFPQDFSSPSYPKHGDAKSYEEQFLGDWSVTSQAYRYYYAIDDARGRCDSSEASCRAYGKPIFEQNRVQLTSTDFTVDPKDDSIYQNQQKIYGFTTVLLKDGWDNLLDDNKEPVLACRKDELFCDKFTSGNVTEYFRNPGNQTCVWVQAKHLSKNLDANIPADGDYSGWFREGTDVPCYPPYLSSGSTYLVQYTGENDYSGWNAKCPVDQSECTELVDHNDTSDTSHPSGKPYYVINGPKLDKSSCGGTADPMGGCVLFQDKGVGTLEANAAATYAKVTAERGAAQSPIDCAGDPTNEYCVQTKAGTCQSLDKNFDSGSCNDDSECGVSGICQKNDSNIVLRVKMDRECARWIGCRSGETVYDPVQQKFVTQCSQTDLCQKNENGVQDSYCSQFVDRSKEDYLQVGEFIDALSYSARQTGFGRMDYSGYAIPNDYLPLDIVTRPVGYDLLGNTGEGLSYKNDYRLVAGLPIDGTNVVKATDPSFNLLQLCKDNRTGRYGYVYGSDQKCYLPIGMPTALQIVSGQQANDTTQDIQRLYYEFVNTNTKINNASVQSAMPQPECRIYPEETSPLPNSYVSEWNTSVDPPSPTKMADGYQFAKTCVYGEDCSCSYRKVRYTGAEKYYSLDGAPPAVGVCIGGERDGQSCVPDGYVAVNNQNQILVNPSSQNPSFQNTCTGGACQAIQDVVYVNGKYGYCLEWDKTRINDSIQSTAPCLTWDPKLVIGGIRDATHYSPTAGYLPPQGSGKYYCVSGAGQQQIITPSVKKAGSVNGGSASKDFLMPGLLTEMSFSRSDVWWPGNDDDYSNLSIDGKSNRIYGYSKEELDHLKGSEETVLTGTDMRNMPFACRRTSLCEGFSMVDGSDRAQGELDANDTEGRWIMTGDGIASSYMEYFIPVKNSNTLNYDQFDYRYGLFKFGLQPYSAGAACKWNPRWAGLDYPKVEAKSDTNFSCQSYLQDVGSTSKQVYDTLKNGFNGILDRSNEHLLSDEKGDPFKIKCMVSAGDHCYFKYWETGYQNNGQDEFSWIQNDKAAAGDFDFNLRYHSYYAKECRAGQPFFGIRAMFQDVNPMENELSSEQARSAKLAGPWQFVGFWFTTCLPTQTTNDPGWMYLRLDTVKVDVCREVGQVVSSQTRENAVFADRVWNSGVFVLPSLGLRYSSRNSPFGSSIATREIGHDPMIVGASVPGASDANFSPTFVDSGLTVSPSFSRQNAWVPLTNLFARVYKVWRWEETAVMSWDKMCVNGSKQGKVCYADNKYDAMVACSDYATCDTEIDAEILNQNWRCNSLSGVNRGLHCGDKEYPSRNQDSICHNAPMAYEFDGSSQQAVLTPLYGSCIESNTATLEVPISMFGTCYYGSNDFYCDVPSVSVETSPEKEGDLSAIEGGDKIKFQVKKCTAGSHQGEYYLSPSGYPSFANQIKKTVLTNFQISITRVPLWVIAVRAMKDIESKNVKISGNNIDCSGGTWTQDIQSILTDPTLLKKYAPEATDWPTDNNWISSGYGINTIQAMGQSDNQGHGLANLYQNDFVYKSFELGYWDKDRMNLIRANFCGYGTVNRDERCGEAKDLSEECPLRIDLPTSQWYKDNNNGWQTYASSDMPGLSDGWWERFDQSKHVLPYAQCIIGDQNDQYKDLYPNTGYCKGFNPLSRCKLAGDCSFDQFEFWGAYDDGTGKGKNYQDAITPIIRTAGQERGGLGFSPQVGEPIQLPMPYTGNMNVTKRHELSGLDSSLNLSQPASLVSFSSSYLGDYDRDLEITQAWPMNYCLDSHLELEAIQNGYFGANMRRTCYDHIDTKLPANNTVARACPIATWEAVCSGISDAFPGLMSSFRLWVACEAQCRAAAVQRPSGYAQNLNKVVDKTYNGRYRMAAVAPFAINPLNRFVNSIAVASKFVSGVIDPVGALKQWRWDGWVMGKLYTYSLYDFTDLAIHEPSPISTVINQFITINSDRNNAPDAYQVNYLPLFSGGKGLKTWLDSKLGFGLNEINSTLPWDPQRLYFTNVFPLVKTDYGAPEMLQNFKMGPDVGPAGWNLADWTQRGKIWSGFGMSQKLIRALDEYIGFKNSMKDGNGNPGFPAWGNAAAQSAYIKFWHQFEVDMHDEFVNKTGWGSFMTPSAGLLQLYPGAIPAAVPREDADQGPITDRYNVFIPGHCEPPTGGTDVDTVVGKPANVILTEDYGSNMTWNDEWAYYFTNPWESWKETYDNGKPIWRDINKDGYPDVDSDGKYIDGSDKYPEAFVMSNNHLQWTSTEKSRHEFIGGNVIPEAGVDSRSISIEGPVGNANSLRTACRCIGGSLNGTVQESQDECNLGLPDDQNPDKLPDDQRNLSGDDWCRKVADYVSGAWVPTAECQSDKGSRDAANPDQDDNKCTHNPGYVPRGDVCRDGREQCLVTYKLNDPISTDDIHVTDKTAAPSATDVTAGLDTLYYISQGRTERDAKQYVSWYQPGPPRVAIPDLSKTNQSAGTQAAANIDEFSVDGRAAGLVYYSGGQGRATVRFYAWAEHNQGPIKNVVIDWGDGTIQSIDDVQLKNQKPLCNTTRECEFIPGLACNGDGDCPPGSGACRERGTCVQQAYKDCFTDADCGGGDTCAPRVMFGNSMEACRQGYLEFSHVYKCDENASPSIKCGGTGAPASSCENEPGLACGNCKTGEACADNLAPRNGCYNVDLNRCRYTPRVMVKDNWGWCTGDCSQPDEEKPGQTNYTYPIRHPNGGCYDGVNTKFNVDVLNNPNTAQSLPNECAIEGVNTLYRPWIIYRGAVEIAPQAGSVYNPTTGKVQFQASASGPGSSFVNLSKTSGIIVQ